MAVESLQQDLMDSLNLVVQIPLILHRPLVTSHPLLARHKEELELAAAAMWADETIHRLSLSAGHELLHVYLVPTGHRTGLLLAWDLSLAGRMARRYQKSLVQAYREALYATTGGRMLVVDPVEISELIEKPVWDSSHVIDTLTDIGACRNLVLRMMLQAEVPSQLAFQCALAVSEAVTNALKHATGGEFRLIRMINGWSFMVSDRGSGIDLMHLPLATLLSGYSTKKSLGLGFTAMLKCANRLVLASSERGTTVLLQLFDSHVESGR